MKNIIFSLALVIFSFNFATAQNNLMGLDSLHVADVKIEGLHSASIEKVFEPNSVDYAKLSVIVDNKQVVIHKTTNGSRTIISAKAYKKDSGKKAVAGLTLNTIAMLANRGQRQIVLNGDMFENIQVEIIIWSPQKAMK